MTTFKKMFPYLFVCAIAFYVLPLLGKDTGNFMFILLVLMPLTCFITSIIYGVINGVSFVVPLAIGLLFIPTISIYYNSSAWVYIFVYSVISLVGNLIGRAFKK